MAHASQHQVSLPVRLKKTHLKIDNLWILIYVVLLQQHILKNT